MEGAAAGQVPVAPGALWVGPRYQSIFWMWRLRLPVGRRLGVLQATIWQLGFRGGGS